MPSSSILVLAAPLNVLDQRITRGTRRARSLAHHAQQRPLIATPAKAGVTAAFQQQQHARPYRPASTITTSCMQHTSTINPNLQPRKAKYGAAALAETVQEALEGSVDQLSRSVEGKENVETAASAVSEEVSLLEVAVTRPKKPKHSRRAYSSFSPFCRYLETATKCAPPYPTEFSDYEFISSPRVIAMDEEEWEDVERVPAVKEVVEIVQPKGGVSYAAVAAAL